LGIFVHALSVVDTPAHMWDIGASAGLEVHLVADVVADGVAAARGLNIARNTPGGIKDALVPPPGADAQARFLAYLGRRAW
jgi:hypothetical protein